MGGVHHPGGERQLVSSAVVSSEVPQESPERGASERSGIPWLRWAVQLSIAAAVLYLTWRFLAGIGWQPLGDRLGEARKDLLLVATLSLFGRFVLQDIRWRIAFQRLGDAPSRIHSLLGLLGAVFANHVLPAARVIGGFLRARYGSRTASQSFGRAYGVVLFDQVSHQVVIATATVLALAGMAWVLGHPWVAGTVVLALLAVVVLFGPWLRRKHRQRGKRWAEDLSHRLSRFGAGGELVLEHGQEAVDTLVELLKDPLLRRISIVLGLGFLLLNGVAQWLVFLSLDSGVSLLAALVAVALGAAIGGFTGTPGGVGTTEAGMIMTYVALEIPEIEAAAATLLYRGLHYLLVVAFGLPAVMMFELRAARRQDEEPDA